MTDPYIGRTYRSASFEKWYVILVKRTDAPLGKTEAYWMLCIERGIKPRIGWDSLRNINSGRQYEAWDMEIPGYEDSVREPRGEYA